MTPRQQLLEAVAGLRAEFTARWDDGAIAGRGSFEPRLVMLHHTAGTDSLHFLQNVPGLAPVPGAHFLVSRDGTVHVLSRFVAYHAGRGGPRWGVAAGMANHAAWGIEIEDLGRGLTMTESQVDAAARLSAGLLRAMGVGLDALVQHKEWSTTGKVDTLYPTAFWRDRVAAHLTPPTTEEPDMLLTDKIPVPEPYRALVGSAEVPVGEVMWRTLAVVKRLEAAEAARSAGLAAAVGALTGGATAQDIVAAVDAAVAKYLGGPIPAQVSISVTPAPPA